MRRRSSRAIRAAISAALLLLPVGAGRADPGAPSGAIALISTTVDEVLVILNDPKLDRTERLARLEALAHQRFDFVTMSQLVVARYWKTFTPEQQQQFVDEFTTFLSRSYGDRIDRYTNEKVEVVGEVPAPAGDRKVMTRIVGGDYGGAEVEYRDQFSSVLARDGADGLLEQLQKKNAEATPEPRGA